MKHNFKNSITVKSRKIRSMYFGELMTVTSVSEKHCECVFYDQIGVETFPIYVTIPKKNLFIV